MGAHVNSLDEEAKETRERREILIEAIEKLRHKEKDAAQEDEEENNKKSMHSEAEYEEVANILSKFLVVSESAFLDTVDL